MGEAKRRRAYKASPELVAEKEAARRRFLRIEAAAAGLDDPHPEDGPFLGTADEETLATHSWQWDENSNGNWYEICRRCLRHKDDCLPNEFHPVIACDDGTWNVAWRKP